MSNRDEFEAWISAPPYERRIDRFPGSRDTPWPGQYRDADVDQAWRAWEEATKRAEAERDAMLAREAALTEEDSALDGFLKDDDDSVLIKHRRKTLAQDDTQDEAVPPPETGLRAAATAMHEAMTVLIEKSEGVAGFHPNGDVALWEELLGGGHYEAWLGVALDDLAAALHVEAPQKDEREGWLDGGRVQGCREILNLCLLDDSKRCAAMILPAEGTYRVLLKKVEEE